MANKKEKEKRARENVALQYKKSAGKLLPFYGWAIVVSLVVVICYFLNWVYVYNSDYGIEVKASGFSFIAAASSDNYSSADKIYGDLAMPFYYYAKASCETLGAVTLTAFILNVSAVVVLLAVRTLKLQELSFVSVAFSFVSSVLLAVAFVVALGMKNDKILSVYCGGNPKCYIGSLSVLPALVSFAGTAIQSVGSIKFLLLKADYRKKVAEMETSAKKSHEIAKKR